MTGNGLGQGLSDMWRSVLLFVPKMLAFVAILVIGYVIARLLRAAVGKLLHRAGFDRVVERGAAARLLRAGTISASDLCARIVFWAVILFALQFAFGVWGPNPVSTVLTALIAWLPRAFVAIVIIVVAAAIAGAVHDLIAGALGGLGYGRVLARAVATVIVALGVIAALDQVEIATSVTQPLLIAVLATVAGVTIVGVGGGLVRPMQQRWEGWLDKAGAESAAIRVHAKAYTDERARLAAEEEARRAEEAARRAEEEARRVEEARLRAEQERRLEDERRLAEEARRAAAAREAEEAKAAEEARRVAEAARVADQARQTEEARRAAEAKRAEEAEQARKASLGTEETQIIPTQQRHVEVIDTRRADAAEEDRPHLIPGFDRYDQDADPATTASIPAVGDASTTASIPAAEDASTTTAFIPAADDSSTTAVISSGTDRTLILPEGEQEDEERDERQDEGDARKR